MCGTTLEASQVNPVLGQFLIRLAATQRCGDEPSRLLGQEQREEHVHLALDGKTRQRTLGHQAADERTMHQLALSETQTGVLLKEQVVGDKQHELSIVSPFLLPVWVKGRLISADALHTQHAFCTAVALGGGFYLLEASGNPSTLHDDLALFFDFATCCLAGLAQGT